MAVAKATSSLRAVKCVVTLPSLPKEVSSCPGEACTSVSRVTPRRDDEGDGLPEAPAAVLGETITATRTPTAAVANVRLQRPRMELLQVPRCVSVNPAARRGRAQCPAR